MSAFIDFKQRESNESGNTNNTNSLPSDLVIYKGPIYKILP